MVRVLVDAGNRNGEVGRKAPVGAEQERAPTADSIKILLPLLLIVSVKLLVVVCIDMYVLMY